MQQMTGRAMTTTTCSQDSGTGPGAKATTGAGNCGSTPPASAECSATVILHVTHNRVTIRAELAMGGHEAIQQVWARRRGPGRGWVMVTGCESFADRSASISTELAEIADRMPFPFELANMLPGTKATAAAVAQAALEVANG